MTTTIKVINKKQGKKLEFAVGDGCSFEEIIDAICKALNSIATEVSPEVAK